MLLKFVSGVGREVCDKIDRNVGNKVGEEVELEIGGKRLSVKMLKMKLL